MNSNNFAEQKQMQEQIAMGTEMATAADREAALIAGWVNPPRLVRVVFFAVGWLIGFMRALRPLGRR